MSTNRRDRNGASKFEMLIFFGLLFGWGLLQAFVLPKSSGS